MAEDESMNKFMKLIFYTDDYFKQNKPYLRNHLRQSNK